MPGKPAKKKVTMNLPSKVEGQESKTSTNGKESLLNGHNRDKGKNKTAAVNGARRR